MGAIVKLGTASNTGGPLKVPANRDGTKQLGLRSTKDMMGVKVTAVKYEQIGGKPEPKILEGKIDTRQTVLIRPALRMLPTRYQILIGFNPELLKYGQVSTPNIVSHFDVDKICLQFTALKRVDLSKLDYVFELYMID